MKYLFAFLLFSTSLFAQIEIQNLRCEMLNNPLGIDKKEPRLSWQIVSSERGVLQTSFQILVASSVEKLANNEADLWDSGVVSSSQSIHNTYKGKPLRSRMQCFWKARVWTNKGMAESKSAFWSMGLLNYVDWKGRWIGLDSSFAWDSETTFSRLSARYFRKEFEANKPIKTATATIIGLGLYELYINGQKIGNQVLAPTPTDYTRTVKYNTFDVTNELKQGKNAIGTILGNGRYFTMRQHYKANKIKTFGYPKMLLNIDIEYADGSKQTLSTDDSWKVTANGPIRSNNEYDGEEYDATKELMSWNTVGFDDSKWQKAELVQEPGGDYEAQMNAQMAVMQTIKPMTIKPIRPNVYVLDMGQNMVGWLRIKLSGAAVGQKITMRFAETLQPNGELYVRNLRDAKVTDVYICKGGTETWQPSFVYHGFRYVELSGFAKMPAIDDFEGQVVYDNLKNVGTFSSSDATLNQIFKNAYWGISGNYKGMPIDCPQRNERQPWLGDRTTGAYGESFLFNNHTLYAKWLDDIRQSQKADGSLPDVAPNFWRYYGDNVTWPGTYLSVAEMLYRQFGDVEVVKKHYPSMKKWIDYMAEKYTKDGLVTKDKYGDWCVPPEAKELIHAKDPTRITDGELIASASYIHYLELMQNFANILHKNEDFEAFLAMAKQMKAAFNKRFLNTNKAQYANNTVTANVLPLAFGIAPDSLRSKIFEQMLQKILVTDNAHISTGVIGTQWLMRTLTQFGRADVAYRLASNRSYPSWGYMAENGATTIWELWNGNTANPEMNSGNHVMLLGDLLVWYYEHLAGIKSANGAFKSIILKPEKIEGINNVSALYKSIYGNIVSNFKKENAKIYWQIEIPANTTATVYFPTQSPNKITENGKKIEAKFLKIENGATVYEVGSGKYNFVVE